MEVKNLRLGASSSGRWAATHGSWWLHEPSDRDPPGAGIRGSSSSEVWFRPPQAKHQRFSESEAWSLVDRVFWIQAGSSRPSLLPEVAESVRGAGLAPGTDGREARTRERFDGKWKVRCAPARPVDELAGERTSPAVKATLKSLLEALAPGRSSKRAQKGKTRA